MCWVQPLSSAWPISNPLHPPIVGAVIQWDVSNYLSLKPGYYDDSSRRAQSKLGRLVWNQKWSECLRAEGSLVDSDAALGWVGKNVLSILRGLQCWQFSGCLWAPIRSPWARLSKGNQCCCLNVTAETMVFPHPQDHILPDIVINSRDNSSNDDKSSNNNKNNKTSMISWLILLYSMLYMSSNLIFAQILWIKSGVPDPLLGTWLHNRRWAAGRNQNLPHSPGLWTSCLSWKQIPGARKVGDHWIRQYFLHFTNEDMEVGKDETSKGQNKDVSFSLCDPRYLFHLSTFVLRNWPGDLLIWGSVFRRKRVSFSFQNFLCFLEYCI